MTLLKILLVQNFQLPLAVRVEHVVMNKCDATHSKAVYYSRKRGCSPVLGRFLRAHVGH
jgi:hypothetical protein